LDAINNNYLYTPVSGPNNIKYAEKDSNSTVNFEDFLNLMVAQLQNQDFTNPIDDSQYMVQMAQLSMVQQMQSISQDTNRSYAASLLGKVATVSKQLTTGGNAVETGYIDSITFSKDEVQLMINDRLYKLTDIVQIFDPGYTEAGVQAENQTEQE
jgi:flagellar basal-body rod modification protein FlgD